MYSAFHPSTFEVVSGKTFWVETADAYRGKIQKGEDSPTLESHSKMQIPKLGLSTSQVQKREILYLSES